MFITVRFTDRIEVIEAQEFKLVEEDGSFITDTGRTIYKDRIISVTTIAPTQDLSIPTHITTSIKPRDLDIDNHSLMASKWQNSESEASAWWLISFAKNNGSWRNFTKKEIDDFYQKKWPNHNFNFNYTTRFGDILVNNDGTYSFTDYFIIEVHRLLNPKANPKR